MFIGLKLFKYLFILIGVVIVIVVRIKASRRHKGLVRDISKAKTDPEYAASLVESLEFFYGGFEFTDAQSVVAKIKGIQMNQKMGSFYFGEIIEADAFRFILPVKREVIMYEEKTEKPYVGGFQLILFAVIVNQEKSKVEVYADLYEDPEDKDIKTEFGKGLKGYLGL